MRYTILAVGMALLCGLAFTACSNKADLGPTTGRTLAVPTGVYGYCMDGSTYVNGILCKTYDLTLGGPVFSEDTSYNDPVEGNGFYNCENPPEGGGVQPDIGDTLIVIGYSGGSEWGRSRTFLWPGGYAPWKTVYKN